MAKANPGTSIIPTKEAQELIRQYCLRVLEDHQKFSDYHTKMLAIDIAYARYVSNADLAQGLDETGRDAATTPVGVFGMDSITPPVVIAQVDSAVAYLADVYLSGYPLFPVVSTPANKDKAEQLETITDDHATIGGYPRQLLMFLRNAVKYNAGAVEVEWQSIKEYTVGDSPLMGIIEDAPKVINKQYRSYTAITNLDMYNTIWDKTVAPGDVAKEADFAGYIQLMSRTKLKRFMQRLNEDKEGFNTKEALASTVGMAPYPTRFYKMPPKISNYITARLPLDQINWFEYLGGKSERMAGIANYEVLRLYARITPDSFQLTAPEPKTPQIWRFILVNGVPVSAKRITSAYDYLPILMGQPIEDGLGFQTQSIGEAAIPFQQAAKTLVNIRFNAARRAVSDRAIYDATVINPADINAPVPAAKIPIRPNSLQGNRTLAEVYHQIPFDMRGTETTISDAMSIVNFGKELSGMNDPQRGKFQPGNKSVKEWTDTMGGADARLRLPALTLEYQFFTPLKSLIILNILQYASDQTLINQKSGKEVNVSIEDIRQSALSFKIADGYTPKSKLASTEAITSFTQMILQNQLLTKMYGPLLPGMISHLAQLMGIHGLEEYAPQQPPNMQQQGVTDPNEGTEPNDTQDPAEGTEPLG